MSPDDQEDAFSALARGDAGAPNKVTALLQAYLSSLDGILADQTRDDFLTYSQQLDSVAHVWSITSPPVLAALGKNGVAAFQTTLSDLDGAFGPKSELKILQIAVALIGGRATDANQTIFEVGVIHPGSAVNRRFVDQAVVPIMAPAVHDAVDATLQPIAPSTLTNASGDPAQEPRSWGRSPVTTWQISLAPATAAALDLSDMTELQFGVEYASTIRSPLARGRATSDRRAIADRRQR